MVTPDALEGLRVLDLGCGAGRDVYLLSWLVGEQGEVVGVDMTAEQLAIAERHQDYHAERYGHARSNVRFVEGRIEALGALGLPAGGFDLIVSNSVLSLSPDKKVDGLDPVAEDDGQTVTYRSDLSGYPDSWSLDRDRRFPTGHAVAVSAKRWAIISAATRIQASMSASSNDVYPRPDLAQMVDEDLLQGQANGEPLDSLLPEDLKPQRWDRSYSGRAVIQPLIDRLGREVVRSRLTQHLLEIGVAGAAKAEAAYRVRGLEYERRGALGLVLQRLFTEADRQVCEGGWHQASGLIAISRERCALPVQSPQAWAVASQY